ncbi:MAG: DMT family transporter, partial [Gorillibacterium sp.]|nr:DMT family transporter [Gorillibacterium sp.]
MNGKDITALFSLAAIWGASFLFMKIAAPVLGPFFTTELRVTIAGIVLLVYAFFSKHHLGIMGKWKQFLLLGALNAAIPFSLICMAELNLNASLAAILNATTPMFTALIAWGWSKEALTRYKTIGLLIGLVGVAVLVGWTPTPMGRTGLYSVLFSLLAAVSYGLGGVYTAREFKGVKPIDMAIGQQFGAGLLLFPFALIYFPKQAPSAEVVYSILGLSIMCTAVAYLIFFRLISSIGAVKAVSVTLLVPIFGIVWG